MYVAGARASSALQAVPHEETAPPITQAKAANVILMPANPLLARTVVRNPQNVLDVDQAQPPFRER